MEDSTKGLLVAAMDAYEERVSQPPMKRIIAASQSSAVAGALAALEEC